MPRACHQTLGVQPRLRDNAKVATLEEPGAETRQSYSAEPTTALVHLENSPSPHCHRIKIIGLGMPSSSAAASRKGIEDGPRKSLPLRALPARTMRSAPAIIVFRISENTAGHHPSPSRYYLPAANCRNRRLAHACRSFRDRRTSAKGPCRGDRAKAAVEADSPPSSSSSRCGGYP